MVRTLPLNEMTIEEKLQMMEALWDDLSRNAPDLATPHWHGKVLAQREQALERGEDQLEDWYQARERIEKEIR
ncbi:MAG: addiction module protein [Wenzhouxiangella sp.]|nr:addiction module protein [Wenzhouxiangella sp.]MCH8479146.1 addiction module protein [Wenzhouxiangella sp.]